MSRASSFVLSNTTEKAKQAIERQESLKLTQADAILLVKALDGRATVNARLKEAARRYECKAQ